MMPFKFTKGDIFLTHCPAIGIGLSANGHLSVSPFHTALQDRYPVFVSDYSKRGRTGTLPPGTAWLWREGLPWLVGFVVQETPHGPARLRYVETALLNLAKSSPYEGLHSLALMRFGDDGEWPAVRNVLEEKVNLLPFPLIIYDEYMPGLAAESDPL